MNRSKLGNRAKLLLEHLECRAVPAIAMSNTNDILNVSGDPVGTLTVTQTAPGAWTINDNGTDLYTAVQANGGVRITTEGDNDTIILNSAVGGETITGNVSINSGNGNDTITIANAGAALNIAGLLQVSGGNGNDTLNLSPGGPLTVQGNAIVNLGAGLTDVYDDDTDVLIQGDLVLQGATGGATSVLIDGDIEGQATLIFNEAVASTATIAATSTLGRLSVVGSIAASTVTLNGSVLGLASVNLRNGTNSFTTGAASVIGGALTYFGGAGNDTVQLGGAIDGTLTANLGASVAGGNNFDLLATGSVDGAVNLTADGGATDMDFIAGSLVAGNLAVITRGTANTFDMLGGMGGGQFSYTGGGGVDAVNWAATSGAARLSVNLGAANDTFTLTTGAYGGGTIDGGTGAADDFTNIAPISPPLTVRNFEL